MKTNLKFVSLLILVLMLMSACSMFSREGSDVGSEPSSNDSQVSERGGDTGDEGSAPERDQDTQQEAAGAELFDTAEMEEKLKEFVIRDEDLPHDYRLPPNAEYMLPTITLINEMGEIEAKTYVAATGRVNGWGIHLERVNKEDFAPVDIESRIELFETSDGAALAISPEYFSAYQGDTPLVWMDGGCEIGDECLFYFIETYDPATELTKHRYEVAFVYRNVLVWVMGRGLDIDVKPEYILNGAQLIFDKLEEYAQSQ